MTNIFIRAITPMLVACIVSACSNDSGQRQQSEIDQLRTDVDQLTNEVGRLEFRIYELENFHPGTGPGDTPDSPAAAVTDGQGPEPAANPGRYDITPVE
jgi:outer membrane murein-binding lipoprotein Lpp